MQSALRTRSARILGLFLVAYVLLVKPPLLAHWLMESAEWTGFVLLAVAAFGRLWCLLFVGGRKSESLVMEGPYSVVRNPLYAFSFIGAVGFGLAVQNLPLCAVVAAYFALSHSLAVAREEGVLRARFGAAYEDYCRRTPRWLPNWRGYREPETLVVYPAALRRGIFDVMWFLWAFLLWEVLEDVRAAGVFGTVM